MQPHHFLMNRCKHDSNASQHQISMSDLFLLSLANKSWNIFRSNQCLLLMVSVRTGSSNFQTRQSA
jgi:hypothetical protein